MGEWVSVGGAVEGGSLRRGPYCNVIVSLLCVHDKNVTPHDRQELAAGQMEDVGDLRSRQAGTHSGPRTQDFGWGHGPLQGGLYEIV